MFFTVNNLQQVVTGEGTITGGHVILGVLVEHQHFLTLPGKRGGQVCYQSAFTNADTSCGEGHHPRLLASKQTTQPICLITIQLSHDGLHQKPYQR